MVPCSINCLLHWFISSQLRLSSNLRKSTSIFGTYYTERLQTRTYQDWHWIIRKPHSESRHFPKFHPTYVPVVNRPRPLLMRWYHPNQIRVLHSFQLVREFRPLLLWIFRAQRLMIWMRLHTVWVELWRQMCQIWQWCIGVILRASWLLESVLR